MPVASKTNGKRQPKQAHEPSRSPSPVSESPLQLQKRILPSRSRRGGPGVGNCDIDLTIIDAQRRAEENKPLIPASSVLLLVTDSSIVPPEASTSADGRHETIFYHSYFDRPEVIQSFREQATIETPVFTTIPEDAVGGRLRARTGDEDYADTTDTAYILRHRKYETFEKRQRRREKEKLTHEHHKLKNRIEQLRSMDAPAFGGKDIGESERRRKAMLATAVDLEERYRALLPEPRRPEKRVSARPVRSLSEEEELLPAAAGNETGTSAAKITIKIRAPLTAASSSASPTPNISIPSRSPPPGRGRKRQIPQKAARSRPPTDVVLEPSPGETSQHESPGQLHHDTSEAVEGIACDEETRTDTRLSQEPHPPTSTEHAPIESPATVPKPLLSARPSPSEHLLELVSEGQSRSTAVPRPTKRIRQDLRDSLGPRSEDIPSPHSHSHSHSHSHPSRQSMGALLRAASRTGPNARKTKRAVEPFGVKLPQEIGDYVDFDNLVPDWVTARSIAKP